MLLNGQAARMATAVARRALSPGGGGASSRCPTSGQARYPIASNQVRALQSANAIVRYKARFRIAEPAATVAVLNAEFGPHVSGASLQYRLIHSSPVLLSEASKPSSKIEETVNRLKEKTGESEVRCTLLVLH